jgi:hypothetical protein
MAAARLSFRPLMSTEQTELHHRPGVSHFWSVGNTAKSEYELRHICSSARPSVCLSNRPYGTTRLPYKVLSQNLKFEDFSKNCREIQVSLKSDKNKVWNWWKPVYIYDSLSHWILLRMRIVSGKGCRGHQNTHFVVRNFFPENRATYEIMWKKYTTARQATDDNIIRSRNSRIQTHTHNIQYLLLFRINNGYANAPQCYVTRALPVL